ncbi:MAG: site-specific integrase, partial [Gammaproteobacteria bacterium]|nr:site-specific integrase [Gammaproteobacteria bacterium]
QMERLADTGRLTTHSISTSSVSDLLEEYLTRVTRKKRGSKQETYLIRRVQMGPLGSLPISWMSPQPFADYRDQRLKTVSPGTLRREFSVLHHAFRIARDEWGWEIPDNPIARIHLPRLSQPRQRRLEPGEEVRLLLACSQARTPWLRPAVELAVETAMRRGELLNARYEHLQNGLLSIPITKTGVPRTIPLTPRALTVIKALPRSISGHFLPTSANALRLSWERAKRRAMIEDLHFHDLRHEAISRFFEMGLSIPEVALISGHKDYRMLARYTHLRAEDLVGRLKSVFYLAERNSCE